MNSAIKRVKFFGFFSASAQKKKPPTIQLLFHPANGFSTKDQRERAKKFSPKTCFYKVLNISAEASFEDIRKSYIELAKKYHPDVDTGNPAQEEKFKELHEAYSVLSNEKTRAQYDEENGMNSGWKYNFDSADFAENEEKMKEYAKGGAERNKQKMTENEQMFEYFDKKYFKNTEFFKKPISDDNPFEVTRKLQRQKMEGIKLKRDEYVMHYPYTWKAYYERKDGKDPDADDIKKEPSIYLRLLYDFRFPIFFVFLCLTTFAAYESIFDNNNQKKEVKKRDFVREGTGYTVKLTPVNVV